MKFARELKSVKDLSDRAAINALAEQLIYLQRELERVLTQLEQQKKG